MKSTDLSAIQLLTRRLKGITKTEDGRSKEAGRRGMGVDEGKDGMNNKWSDQNWACLGAIGAFNMQLCLLDILEVLACALAAIIGFIHAHKSDLADSHMVPTGWAVDVITSLPCQSLGQQASNHKHMPKSA